MPRPVLPVAFSAVLMLGSGASPRAAGAASSAAPARAPSPAPSAPVERLAIATCDRTYFYAWPVRESVPAIADYPAATNGDAFHIVGTPQLSTGGLALYQTTIDVVAPWGAGKRYWVDSRCVNAG